MRKRIASICLLLLVFSCAKENIEDLTKQPQNGGELTVPKSLREDVNPILEAHCISCHDINDARGNIDLSTYNGILQVTEPRNSSASLLYTSVSGESSPAMPPNEADALSLEDITTIKNWINEGAPNN
jgi:uncharacterized membrane protein